MGSSLPYERLALGFWRVFGELPKRSGKMIRGAVPRLDLGPYAAVGHLEELAANVLDDEEDELVAVAEVGVERGALQAGAAHHSFEGARGTGPRAAAARRRRGSRAQTFSERACVVACEPATSRV